MHGVWKCLTCGRIRGVGETLEACPGCIGSTWSYRRNHQNEDAKGSNEATCCMVKVTKRERFRSKPEVNMTEDMIRVTLTMPIWKWREVEKGLT